MAIGGPLDRGLVWLGVHRALTSGITKLALAVGAVSALGAMALAAWLAMSTPPAPLPELLTAASWVFVWGAGFLVAVGAALKALTLDVQDGYAALVRARRRTRRFGALARVLGSFVVIFAVTSGATLLVALTAFAGARSWPLAADIATSLGANLAYTTAFSAMLAPVSIAALGARSRAGGYFTLLLIVVIPDWLSGWTERLLPSWKDVLSIPGALAVLRDTIAFGPLDIERLARAGIVIVGVVVLAFVAASAQERRALERGGAP